jgi:hypothetical protein
MTEMPPPDPITAILVGVTEIKGSLHAALDRLERLERDQHQQSQVLTNHGERITALEATNTADDSNNSRLYTGRTVAWAALGVLISLVSTIVAIVLALKGG